MLPIVVSAINPGPKAFDAGLGWTAYQEYTPDGLQTSLVNRAGVPSVDGTLNPRESDGWLPVFNAATFGEGWMDGAGKFSTLRPSPDWASWSKRDVPGTFGEVFNQITQQWEPLVEVDSANGEINHGVMPLSVAKRRYPTGLYTASNIPFQGGYADDLGLGVIVALTGFLAAAAAPAVLASQPAAIVQAPATVVESLAAQAPVAVADVSTSIFGPSVLDTSSFLVSPPSLVSPALEAASAVVPNVGLAPSGYVVNLANSAELIQAPAVTLSLPSVPSLPAPAPATTPAPAAQPAAPLGSSVASAAKAAVTSVATNAAAAVASQLTGKPVTAAQIPPPSNNVLAVWALLATAGAVALYFIAKG